MNGVMTTATKPVAEIDGFTLTPCLLEGGDVILCASKCDVMTEVLLPDAVEMSDGEIFELFRHYDIAAMREAANEFAAVDPDASDWLLEWCDRVEETIVNVSESLKQSKCKSKDIFAGL